MVESIFAFLTLIAIFVGVTWVVRSLARASGKRTDPAAPTLPDVLAVEEDALPPLEEYRFRQPHGIQVAIYLAATGLLLIALLWSLAAHGWSLLGIVLGAADILLLFLHGAPLAVNIARSVGVTTEGIETKGLLVRRSISWWEIHSFRVKEDLSGFRVDGMRRAFSFDTSSFGSAAKLQMYSAIRAHLLAHQHPLSVFPTPGATIRFLKSNAISVGIFLVVAFAAAFTAEQFLPEGNVLGLRCSYASDFLREKYDLPERRGCVILRVNQGTGAYEAGLLEGDLIVALEGVPITSGPQFTAYWESLDKHTQEFTIVRPGVTAEKTFKVTLGGRGRLPEYDPDDPFYFYLRARGAEDMSQAIRDFTTAIELAPDFDLAYAYRGALYNDDHVTELAIADLDKALQLDLELTEAYRERAWYHVFTGDYAAAAADSEAAIDLDDCDGSFETYNYDCHVSHLSLSLAYGERGDPVNLRRGVEEAERAAAFYPERPRSYYLAAYYLAELEDIEQAKDYASIYLQNAEEFGEPGNLIDWAQRLLSGDAIPDEGQDLASSGELEPSALFVEKSVVLDVDPEGEPLISIVRFAGERTAEPPPEIRYLTPDRDYLWAFFEFDNAANVMGVSWYWTQNSEPQSVGFEAWPGTNKGRAWLRLENRFPDEDSENTLTIEFDGRDPVTTNVLLRNEPHIGPLTFSSDPEGAEPLQFYAGLPLKVFAHYEYAGTLPDTTLSWSAEKDGAPITYGDVKVAGSGTLTVPLDLPTTITPGVVDVRIYLEGVLARNGAFAVTTTDIAAAPPFDSFLIGLGNDGQGGLLEVTNEISSNSPEFYYSIKSLRLQPDSTLSISWLRDGDPSWVPQTISGSDGFGSVLDFVPGSNGYLLPGEYRVVITLNTQPVYAEVVVVR